MSDVNDNEMHVVESSQSVGKRLKEAREAKSFSVAEVAAQLRFTKDIVLALEKQQWEKLHGRTYARGYFTNYVKFLGLPQDEMLVAFNIEYTVRDAEPNLHKSSEVKDTQFPWIPVIILILMLVVGWFAYQQWRATQAEPQSQESSAASDAASSSQSNGDDFSPSVVEPLDKAASQSATETPQQVQADQAVSDTTTTLPEPAASTAAPTVTAPQASAQPQTVPSNQTAQKKTQSTLVISFTGTCWVEVTTDSSNKILVNKVMNANQNIKLTSAETLHVLLGNAPVASVQFNNKNVDISSYTQGKVARFTLGAKS